MDIKIKGDTIVSDKFEAKIKEPFIINEKDEKKKYIAFKMEITAKKTIQKIIHLRFLMTILISLKMIKIQ